MKSLIVFCLMCFSFSALAQTVTKVNNNEAMVSTDGQKNFVAGDTVHFLNSELNVSGQGEVLKVSSGGSHMIVKVVSGTVQTGMTIERPISSLREARSGISSKAEGMSYASLSEKEREILQIGEISQTRYVLGGIVGTWPLGLGIGHAIQGRYSDMGWKFTVGELGSLVVVFAGFGSCVSTSSSTYSNCNGGLMFAGAIGYLGFRIWEIVDVWAGPLEHNRRYHELKSRTGERNVTFKPFIIPTTQGGLFGLNMTF